MLVPLVPIWMTKLGCRTLGLVASGTARKIWTKYPVGVPTAGALHERVGLAPTPVCRVKASWPFSLGAVGGETMGTMGEASALLMVSRMRMVGKCCSVAW